MLMYGPTRCLQHIDTNTFIIYNLTGMIEGFRSIQALIPPYQLGRYDTYEFDVNYANWIIYNDPIFVQLMNIMSNVYNGFDVFITISEEDWSADLVDSLMKFIQERYGVVGASVKCIEDYYCISDVEFIEGIGLMNIQNDMERFGELTYRPTKDSIY